MADPHVELNANGPGPDFMGGGVISVTDNAGDTTIRLNGHAGNIEARDVILTRLHQLGAISTIFKAPDRDKSLYSLSSDPRKRL